MLGKLNWLSYVLLFVILITLPGCNTRYRSETDQQPTDAVKTPKPVSTDKIPSATLPQDLTLASPAPSPTADLSKNPNYDLTYFEINEDFFGIVTSFPKISSSTSAFPLWNSIICRLLNIRCYWKEIGNLPEYGPENSSIYYNEYLNFVDNHFIAKGTHSAYVSLINKESDIILVAREPSDDEIELAEGENVGLEVEPVALDAFVFIVNTQNPVDNLSLDQVRGIYTGRITNWNELGWSNNKITAYQRNDNSGSQELMENLVMKDLSMIESPGNLLLNSMLGPYSAIGGTNPSDDDIYGIAYSVYFYAMNMIYIPGNNIETIGIDMVEPTRFTIQDKSYPLTTEVYAVIRTDEKDNSIPRQLRDWLLSTIGQYTVYSSGYVPIDSLY